MRTLTAFAAELKASGVGHLVVAAKNEKQFTNIEVVMGYVHEYLEKAESKNNSEGWANGKQSVEVGVVECAAYVSSPKFGKAVVIIADAYGVIEMFVVTGNISGLSIEGVRGFNTLVKLTKRGSSVPVELGSSYRVTRPDVFVGLRASGINPSSK